MEQNILVFKNLEQIDSVTFHKVKFTGNILLLDKNYKETKTYEQDDIVELSNTWSNLLDEYFKAIDDSKLRQDLKNKDKTLELLLKIKLIDSILDVLRSLDEHKSYVPNEIYLKTVSGLGNSLKKVDKHIKFDVATPIKEQIEHIEAIKGGLQTRYELLFQEDAKVEKKDIMLYYDIKAHIEQTLDRNLPEVINMLQWIAYERLYKLKIKHGREQHQRRTAGRTGR